MALIRVAVSFEIDPRMPPPDRPVHDALRHLRGIEVEASSLEQAEHFVNEMRLALEYVANADIRS